MAISFADSVAFCCAHHTVFTPQDAVKLCYQAAFGAEHLVQDARAVWQYLMEEWSNTAPSDAPPAEPIGADYVRVNLAACKQRGFAPEWIYHMHIASAVPRTDGEARFADACEEIAHMARQGALPFSLAEWDAHLQEYLRGGVRAVHHSAAYRAAENPAYRLVCSDFLPVLPILEKLASLPGSDVCVIAIDGRAAAGKSTLTARLCEALNAGVVHMDDFFLPPALRTEQRLAEPGGNVHRERFAKEVLPHLTHAEEFSYAVFDCGTLRMDSRRTVQAGKWKIVEGAYSCHPAFGKYMQLRVFCDVAPEVQLERICARNGEEMAQMFRTRWIPMEEAYHTAFSVQGQADICLFPGSDINFFE